MAILSHSLSFHVFHNLLLDQFLPLEVSFPSTSSIIPFFSHRLHVYRYLLIFIYTLPASPFLLILLSNIYTGRMSKHIQISYHLFSSSFQKTNIYSLLVFTHTNYAFTIFFQQILKLTAYSFFSSQIEFPLELSQYYIFSPGLPVVQKSTDTGIIYGKCFQSCLHAVIVERKNS